MTTRQTIIDSACENRAHLSEAKTVQTIELVIEELKRQGAKVTWHDSVVGSWHGQESSALGGSNIAIVVTLHDVVDKKAVLDSAPYVFDTTGKLIGAKGL